MSFLTSLAARALATLANISQPGTVDTEPSPTTGQRESQAPSLSPRGWPSSLSSTTFSEQQSPPISPFGSPAHPAGISRYRDSSQPFGEINSISRQQLPSIRAQLGDLSPQWQSHRGTRPTRAEGYDREFWLPPIRTEQPSDFQLPDPRSPLNRFMTNTPWSGHPGFPLAESSYFNPTERRSSQGGAYDSTETLDTGFDSNSGSAGKLTQSDPDSSHSSARGSQYRCQFPGCNTPPFQTQYLLNSHANVHSSARPHYCPVKDCPRGKGGRGFKRRNEMIRHGLVHDSPGYVCPFCQDQDHKYPRPDNLQR